MHVCLISSLYPPEVLGGAEKHVQLVAGELSNRGHKVTVITTGRSSGSGRFSFESEEDRGVNVYRFQPLNVFPPVEIPNQPTWKFLPFKFVDIWNPHSFWMLRNLLKIADPDLIHIHNYEALSGAAFSAVKRSGVPVLHTLHDYSLLHFQPSMYKDGEIWEPGLAFKPYQEINKRLVSSVDTFLSPSEFLIKKHQEYGFFNDEDYRVLRNGISIEREPNKEKTIPKSRGKIRLLYAGRISSDKGIDTLLNAVRLNTRIEIQLDVLGKGAELDKFRSSISMPNVEFHGFVSESDLYQFYKNAHATVVPSKWYDNSPTVIYESMAMGTPVIAAEIGGIPELIQDGKTGYLFEPNDSMDLAETITWAYGNITRETYQSCIEHRDELSIDTHVDRLVDIYYEHAR